MINLLDTDSQAQYRAARMNVQLRRYLVIFMITLAAIAGLFATGALLTWSQRAAAEQEQQSAEASVASYSATRKEAIEFANNLTIAKAILSQEVLYSDMIVQITKTLPSSAVLSSLGLDTTTLTKPITMNARVKTKNDAVTLKNTLEASPLFEDVNINNILQEEIAATSSPISRAYPVSVTLTLKATKGVPGSLLP